MVTKNTELRRLRPAEFYNFALILNPSENWKKLVSVVTEDTADGPKFNGETISIIEQASRHERKPAAAIFLEEWATMGRKRPTLGLLLDLLMKAELFRAADYVAEEILKIEAPPRPSYGPAVPVDVEGALAALLEQQSMVTESDNMNYSSEAARAGSTMNLSRVHYPMHLLETQEENCALVRENDIGVMEIRCREACSIQDLDHAGARRFATGSDDLLADFGKSEDSPMKQPEHRDDSEISDLIKFSEEYVRSDLMKFSSADLDRKDGVEMRESMLPNFAILRGDSSTDIEHEETRKEEGDKDSRMPRRTTSGVPFIRELTSQELPAMLKDIRVSDHFHRELATSELPACINDASGFHTPEVSTYSSNDNNSYSDSSSSILQDTSESHVEYSGNDDLDNNIRGVVLPVPVTVFDSQQLPVTVLEFQKR